MGNDSALGVALFGSAWPLFVETDLHAKACCYTQVLALLSDALPSAHRTILGSDRGLRLMRQCDARGTLRSSRPQCTPRLANPLPLLALMQLAFNWQSTRRARSHSTQLGILRTPLGRRLLTYGALTEGALLMSAGQFRRGSRRLPACRAAGVDDE